MKYFRNIIDHDYESANKVILVAYMQNLTSNKFLNTIQKRAKYCLDNKRK